MSHQKDNKNDNDNNREENTLTTATNYPWNSSLTAIVEVITCGIATGISCSQLYFRLTGHVLPNRTIGVVTMATTSIYIYLREQNMLTARTVRHISFSTSLASLLFELNAYIQETAQVRPSEDTQINDQQLPPGHETDTGLFRRLIVRILGDDNSRRVYYLPGALHSQEVADSSDQVAADITQNGVQGMASSTAIVASSSDDILKGDVVQPTNTVGIDGQVEPPPQPIQRSPVPITSPIPQEPNVTRTVNNIAERVLSLNGEEGAAPIIGNESSTRTTLQVVEEQVSDMMQTAPNISRGPTGQQGGSSSANTDFMNMW